MAGKQEWADSGKQEHAAGEAEYKAAQAKGYAEGTVDRLSGKKDTVVGAVTGDRQQETSGQSLILCSMGIVNRDMDVGNMQHDKGLAQQDLNRD